MIARVLRWVPLAIYAALTFWATISGQIELDAALQYFGAMCALLFLALAGDLSATLNFPHRLGGTQCA